MATTIAGHLVRSARRYRGVSGRELARKAHASQAGLVEVERGPKDATTERLDRLLQALGYQVTTLPTRLGTAAQAAEQISEFLERGDQDGALRVIWQLAADLAAADPALRVALAVTPPAQTGDSRHDALLAGVVDHALSSAHLPRPPLAGRAVAHPDRAVGRRTSASAALPKPGLPRPMPSPPTGCSSMPLSW